VDAGQGAPFRVAVFFWQREKEAGVGVASLGWTLVSQAIFSALDWWHCCREI